MVKLEKGKNDLKTRYPQIALEWHPTKNGNLKPEDVTEGSDKKVWWIYAYDDPKTGRHWEFEWESSIYGRTKKGIGCPQLSGHKVEVGFNDLGSLYPEIAKEWDYELNKGLTPYEITAGSPKKCHWIYPYDDPKTGKHWDFRWEASVSDRTGRNRGCPQLVNQKVEVGFNDLGTLYPEIAKEWDYELNEGITPFDITVGNPIKFHWIHPYDDPKTGMHWEFRWKASVASRTKLNRSCPQLVNQKLERGFNDLATIHPEVAAKWDYELNNGVTPYDIVGGGKEKYNWIYPYDDPKTGKHWDFKFQARISDMLIYTTCPQLAGKKIEEGFNDLATTHPSVAARWDYELNEGKSPKEVFAGSKEQYYWIYPHDDPKTGKHWEFRFKASVADAVKQTSCPQLAGKIVEEGFNDLGSLYPEIAEQWDYELNKGITPFEVFAFSNKYYHWVYNYDDPRTGKNWKFKWRAKISNRVNFPQCPFIINRKIWKGFNDFQTLYPELAKEWHPTKNGALLPSDICGAPDQNVWWLCLYVNPQTGAQHEYEWKASIVNRVKGTGCPYLPSFESKGEQCVKEYLEKKKFRYGIQKTFPGLVSDKNRLLSYDFIVYYEERIVLIEYQGIQHYEPVDFEGMGKEAAEKQFIIQKEHDKRKRLYSKKNNYLLIEIKYVYATYEQIEGYLNKQFEQISNANV